MSEPHYPWVRATESRYRGRGVLIDSIKIDGVEWAVPYDSKISVEAGPEGLLAVTMTFWASGFQSFQEYPDE